MTDARSVNLVVEDLRRWCEAVQQGRYADATVLAEQLSVGVAVLASLQPEVGRVLARLIGGTIASENHAPNAGDVEGVGASAPDARRQLFEFMHAITQAREGAYGPRAGTLEDGPRSLRTDDYADAVTLLASLVRAVEIYGSVMLLPCGVLITGKNLADAVHLVVVGAHTSGNTGAAEHRPPSS